MAEDKLAWFEAALGAVSKVTSEGVDHDIGLVGARCPKCDASSFVGIADAFRASVGRLEEEPNAPPTPGDGGMTDLQIVERFRPPRRKGAAGVTVAAAIPLAVGTYYVYRRFGDLAAQGAGILTVVVTVIVLMTTLRRQSDKYYRARQRWNSLFMCRKCGQLVAS
jgi:hypothetical protein